MGRWLSTHSSDLPSTESTPLSTIWPTRDSMTEWTPLVTTDLVMSTPLCMAPRVMSAAPVTRAATASLALDTVLDMASRAPDTLDDTSSLVSASTYETGQHRHLRTPSVPGSPRPARPSPGGPGEEGQRWRILEGQR